MKRWNNKTAQEGENPKIDAFLEELVQVMCKHGFSLSHEDGHGAFEVEKYDPRNIKWLFNANDATDISPGENDE